MSQPAESEALPGARRSISFFAAAGWTVAAQLALALALQATEAARPGALGDLVSVTACCVLAYSVVVFAMLRVYEPDSSLRRALAVRAVSPVSVLLAAIAGMGIAPTLNVLDEVISRRFPVSSEDLQHQTEIVAKLTATPTFASKVVLLVAVVLIIPAAEEFFFRGMLYGGLRKGRTLAIAATTTAAYFALSHEDPRAMPSIFVAGLLLTWLRGQTGSLIPSLVANAACAAYPMVPLLLSRPPPQDLFPRAVAWGGAAAALLAAFAVQLLSNRDPRAVQGRSEDS